MKNKDRINFFKYLVCPEDIRSDINQFEDWIKNYIDSDNETQDVIEYRSFLILDNYDLFKLVYEYVTESSLYEDMTDVKIDFANSEIKLSIKYESYKVDKSLLDEVEDYFSELSDNGYVLESVTDSDKHNKVILNFSR